MEKIDKFLKHEQYNLLGELNNAKSDTLFNEFVSKINVSDKKLSYNTSKLQDACREFNNCLNCKGLNFCKNEVKGFMYTYDVLNGLCVVNIYPGNGTTYLSEPLYVFSGSFGTDYPFASASRNVGGALSSALGLGTSIFTGNVGGVVSGLAGTIMGAAQTNYSRGGNLSGSHSYMGNYSFKKPFVIIEYPNAWADDDVKDKYGKKVNITLKGNTTLENFSGYTVLERIHLSNIYSTVNNNTFYATQSEMDEIEEILTSGFNI